MNPTLRNGRILELDWLKGFAILSVICIHAKVFSGTWLHEQVIDRAVPIFLVLFGVSSELWWKDAVAHGAQDAAKRWYRARFSRLMIPVWASAALWWVVAAATGYAATKDLDVWRFLATFAGYSPWIGISWFVTIIIQLVLLFPYIRWLVDKLGAAPSLFVSAVVTALCALYLWQIVDAGKWLLGPGVAKPGWYYQWIFSPRVLFHVIAGILIARAGGIPSRRAAGIAFALWAVALALEPLVQQPPDPLNAPLRRQVVMRLADVPVTVCLLFAFRALMKQGRVTSFLAFCGVASWGIYLGHMLVHELIHGLGYAPEHARRSVRVAYALLLLLGGIGLARLGAFLRGRFLRPVPESSTQ